MTTRNDRVEVGELRHSSSGNIYRLVRVDGQWRFVQRISNGTGEPLWDEGMTYRWSAFQWEGQLPVVGEDTSSYPHFGAFIP